MLGTPDAYLLPSLPGLGYLKVDTEKYVQFRAGLASGPHAAGARPSRRRRPGARVRAGGGACPSPRPRRDELAPGGPSELQVLVDRLTGDRPPVHQVWVAPLPDAEPLDSVLARPAVVARPRARRGPARGRSAGSTGRPSSAPSRSSVDLAGAGGHLAVVGSPRTGKSTLLRTLASR